MMDVELFPKIFFGDTADLTGIPITLTDTEGSYIPITPTVLGTTIQDNRLGTGLWDLGAPVITAGWTAEVEAETPGFHVPLGAMKRPVADKTLYLHLPARGCWEMKRELLSYRHKRLKLDVSKGAKHLLQQLPHRETNASPLRTG